MRVPPRTCRLAWARDIVRPAPWAVEPKVSAIACAVPTRSAEPVSIEPPMITGWATARVRARVAAEHARHHLAHAVGDQLAVRERGVGRRRHRAEVRLALGRAERRSG